MGDVRMSKTESFAARKEEVLQRIAVTEANTKAQLEKMKTVQEEYDKLLQTKKDMQEALDSRREMAAMAVMLEKETTRNQTALDEVQTKLNNLNKEETTITQSSMTKSKKKREKKKRRKLEIQKLTSK